MSHDTFESLLIEKSKAVFGYLIKIGANRKEAEDIVQDTLYKSFIAYGGNTVRTFNTVAL